MILGFPLSDTDGIAMTSERSKRTPFEILGIPEGSTAAEIKSAFHAKSKKLHPDVGGDPIFFDILTGAYEEALAIAKGDKPSANPQSESNNDKRQYEDENRFRARAPKEPSYSTSYKAEPKKTKPLGPTKEINKNRRIYTFVIALGVMALGVMVRVMEFKGKFPTSVPKKTLFSFIRYYHQGKVKFAVLDWTPGAVEGTVFLSILGAFVLSYVWMSRSSREGFFIFEKILLGLVLASIAIGGEFFIAGKWIILEVILAILYVFWCGKKTKYNVVLVSHSKNINKK